MTYMRSTLTDNAISTRTVRKITQKIKLAYEVIGPFEILKSSHNCHVKLQSSLFLLK